MKLSNGYNSDQPYHSIASLYDKLMDHVDYDRWAIYIYNLLLQFDLPFGQVLEAGCGTGSFSRFFPLPLTGMDQNFPMLKEYRKKSKANLVCDKLPYFAAIKPGKFTGILALYDTINYLSEDEWLIFFQNAYHILKQDGWIIFDIVTQRCCQIYFENEVFYENFKGGNLVRKTKFDKKKQTQHNFFYINTEKGNFYEHHRQFIPVVSWIKKTIASFPFEVLAVYDDLTTDRLGTDSLRAHFILKKCSR